MLNKTIIMNVDEHQKFVLPALFLAIVALIVGIISMIFSLTIEHEPHVRGLSTVITEGGEETIRMTNIQIDKLHTASEIKSESVTIAADTTTSRMRTNRAVTGDEGLAVSNGAVFDSINVGGVAYPVEGADSGSIMVLRNDDTNGPHLEWEAIPDGSAALAIVVKGILDRISIWEPFGDHGILGYAEDDNTGYSVSLSADGRIMAIGSPNSANSPSDTINILIHSGSTRVYEYINGIGWTPLGGKIIGEVAGDKCGHCVSLSGDGRTLAIGCPQTSGGKGYTKMYEYVGTGWTPLGGESGCKIPGNTVGDKSGYSVSLSYFGRTVAIGSCGYDSSRGYTTVYQYNVSTSTWVPLGENIDGNATGDSSGFSVSLSHSGERVAIGSFGYDSDKGIARVFAYDGTGWTPLGGNIIGEVAGDRCGYSVSLSGIGDTLAIGSPGGDGQSGYTQVVKWHNDSNTWDKLEGKTTGNIVGDAEGDYSGFSVSLNVDGTIIAIGAPYAFDNSGYTQVYEYNGYGPGWIKLSGHNIPGDTGLFSGFSTSLSSNGRTVAIGEPVSVDERSSTDTGLGRVRTYTNDTKHDKLRAYLVEIITGITTPSE